jgi:hypothetical protein
MSDEIIDVESKAVIEFTNRDFPEETVGKDGMNIPDPAFIDNVSEQGLKEVESRREDLKNLPEFPKEWQESYVDEDTKGFDDDVKLPVSATLKDQEIRKLIKKYKRYLRSNLTEIRRLDGAPQYET